MDIRRIIKGSNWIDLIRVDCKISDDQYIKNNILKSSLHDILDLSSVNWEKCLEFAMSSLVVKVCNSFMQSKSILIKDLCEEFHLYSQTIVKYLRLGKKLNLCDFSKESYEIRRLKYKKEIDQKSFCILHNNKIICLYENFDSFKIHKYIDKDITHDGRKNSLIFKEVYPGYKFVHLDLNSLWS